MSDQGVKLGVGDEFDRTTNKIACPHCKGEIQITARVRINAIHDAVTGIPAHCVPASQEEKRVTKLDAWLASLTPTQRGIVQEARDNGIIDALKTAIEFMPALSRPQVVEKFLLTTLAMATPITESGAIPRRLLIRLRDVYPEGKLVVYKSHTILIVTVDRRLVGFLPLSVLNEAAPSKFHDQDPEDAGWFKTRFGYVAGKGPFYDELRRRYLGEFQTVRN